jgi:hypothetical protein
MSAANCAADVEVDCGAADDTTDDCNVGLVEYFCGNACVETGLRAPRWL